MEASVPRRRRDRTVLANTIAARALASILKLLVSSADLASRIWRLAAFPVRFNADGPVRTAGQGRASPGRPDTLDAFGGYAFSVGQDGSKAPRAVMHAARYRHLL